MNQLQQGLESSFLVLELTVQAVFWLLLSHVIHHWNDNKN